MGLFRRFSLLLIFFSSLTAKGLDLSSAKIKSRMDLMVQGCVAITLEDKDFYLFNAQLLRGSKKRINPPNPPRREYPYLVYWDRAAVGNGQQDDLTYTRKILADYDDLYEHEKGNLEKAYFSTKKAFIVDTRKEIYLSGGIKIQHPKTKTHVIFWFLPGKDPRASWDRVMLLLAKDYKIFLPREWLGTIPQYIFVYEKHFDDCFPEKRKDIRELREWAQEEEEEDDPKEREKILLPHLNPVESPFVPPPVLMPTPILIPAPAPVIPSLYPTIDWDFEEPTPMPVHEDPPSPAIASVIPAPVVIARTLPRSGPPLLKTKGLVNLGNTCFMSAVFQSLLKLPSFVSYFFEGKWESQHEVMQAIGALVADYYGKRSENVLRPTQLSRLRKTYFPDLKTGQQDAQEFLTALLGVLDEDQKKGNAPSCIHEIFGFHFRSVLFSDENTFETTKNDYSQLLSLPLPQGREEVKLLQLVLNFIKEETLDSNNLFKFFPNEANQQEFYFLNKKKITLRQDDLPVCLVIHLNRFRTYQVDGQFYKVKNPIPVSYPVDLPFGESMYRLRSVIVHEGANSNSGHYYALVRQDDETWWQANDERVSKIFRSEVESHPSAYVLFYEKVN